MKRKLAVSDATEKTYGWKAELTLLTKCALLFVLGVTFIVIGLASFSSLLVTVGNLLVGFLGCFVSFWLLVFLCVEFQLWKRTRNVGYQLQFLGGLLIILSPLYFLLPLLFEGWASVFTPYGLISQTFSLTSFVSGIFIALYGYRYRGPHADFYRNMVSWKGEKNVELIDGYSDSVLTFYSAQISKVELGMMAKDYALNMGKAGLLLGHDLDESGMNLYPMTYAGLRTLRLWAALVHLYWFSRKPDRLTWIRVCWDGRVDVHISSYDYARISRPVSYRSLCEVVANATVASLLAFSEDNTAGAITALLAERAPPRVKVPSSSEDRLGLVAASFALLLILAGLCSALLASMLSPRVVSPTIANIQWFPDTPGPNDKIEVHAALSGVDGINNWVRSFSVVIFTYFNESRAGMLDMVHVGGDKYVAYLGSFPEGTELTFFLMAYLRHSTLFGSQDVLLVSESHVMRVGRVHVDGESGLSVEGASCQIGSSNNAIFGAWINSSAQVDVAQLFLAMYSLDSSFITRVEWHNLTTSDGLYEAEVQHIPGKADNDSPPLTVVYYMIVSRDKTWNTDSSDLMRIELTN